MFLKKKRDIEQENIDMNNELDDDLTVFEKNNVDLKKFIACECVDFTKSPKYGVIGDKYMKNLYIGATPSSVTFPTFLDELYRFGNIDVSLYISPIENEDAIAQLSKLKTNLEVEYLQTNGNNRRDDMEAKAREAKRLREEVRDGYNKMYEVSTLATIYSNDERELHNDSSRLRQVMARKDIGIKNAVYLQEECYLSNKPLMNNYMNEYHTFDKRSLACTFPFTTSNVNHKNGIPIGRDMDSGLPILYDTFDSSLKNYNMVIFAASGGGKSTFIKMLSSRSATFDDIMTISLDVEGEYRDTAETLGGENITLSHREDSTIINFFDVTTEYVENKLNNTKVETILLDEKISSVTDIILTLAKGQTGSNQEYYCDITRSIIKECVSELYKNIGITKEPQSLYENVANKIDENGNIVGGYVKKTMPTLSDWYKVLEKLAKVNKTETYIKYYDYLLKVMKEYTRYTNGTFTCFDGQSTITINREIPFINFDVSELNEANELPLAQHILTDFIWEQLIKNNEGGQKIRMIVDEAWRMAKLVNGVPVYPEALAFLEKLFRRARKMNTSAVVISQQFNEFYNEQTQNIIMNSDVKLFLPPDTTSVDGITEVFHLTQGETAFLKIIKTGEGLFKCGSSSSKLKIDIPDFEMEFVQTNQNELYKKELVI